MIRHALLIAGFGAIAFPEILINGAGATFPYPIYAKWFDEFQKIRPESRINYQSIGSGAGIRLLQTGTVDFGASDRPIPDSELAALRVSVLHFPTVVGAVVPVYNIAGIASTLNFSPEVLAGIQSGDIRRWDDRRIASINPKAALPAADIVPVHRSDGSGTTYIWTEYLSKTNAAWAERVGRGAAVKWPVGIGAKGNEGVAGFVKQTPNAFGYVELVYALQNGIPFGAVRNRSGRFVKADVRTIGRAAESVADSVPRDFRVSITDPTAPDAYPVSSFTWLLTPSRIDDTGKRKIIAAFLEWMLTKGQRMAGPLGYAPLPSRVAEKAADCAARSYH